jgi:hypothetical protein
MNTMIRNQQVAGSNPAVGSPSVSSTYVNREADEKGPFYTAFLYLDVGGVQVGFNSRSSER